VRAARQFASEALEGLDAETIDAAVLLASELVTNSILHARSTLEIVVTRAADLVRIEVSDESPLVPTPRGFSTDAATGRGLQILDALSTRWGVESNLPGKIVWFELERPKTAPTPEGTGSLVTITIRGLPVVAYRLAIEEYEGIIREFRLIVAADSAPQSTPPARLLELIGELDGRYSGFSQAQSAELERAIATGSPSIDLVYELPRTVGEACLALNAMLDEADEFCREGAWLLSLVPSPGTVAFRRWFLAEFARQCDGSEPIPFADSDERREMTKDTP
jgi:hypothetical protein